MNSIPTAPEPRVPELLAPAGDWQCAKAAIENGADAIYFGLDCGFNARFRAQNFGLRDLPELMPMLRQRGVRGYVTMNTLAFGSELPKLVEVIEQVARAGVDAILVQDFGVARIARAVCPDLEIHASTQMSLTSAETIAVAADLGLARVVLARELSVKEITKISAATEMPLEVFIHGALCVAYSGQCLTSESLGGRSANRGQCAQACRLPYDIISDGELQDLDNVQYLLSPQDLAGYAAIPDLIAAGVSSLKIEGRLKTPEYVANITSQYRRAIDDAVASSKVNVSDDDVREMELSFSRGFSPGWLEGNDHKRLVPGIQSAKQGIKLGVIDSVRRGKLLVTVDAAVACGDGIAIECGPQSETQGGRIYTIESERGESLKSAAAGASVWLSFGRGEIDWQSVEVDATVYKNDDPKLNKRLRSTFSGEKPRRRRPIRLTVIARAGQPLTVTGVLSGNDFDDKANRTTVTVTADKPLEVATKHAATPEMLGEKLTRLGGTAYESTEFDAIIEDAPMVPASLLNQLRRDLVSRLDAVLASAPERVITKDAGIALLAPIESSETAVDSPAELAVLCRNLDQLHAAIAVRPGLVYADFHDIREYKEAVPAARDAGVPIALATIRMQKPGEMGLIKAIVKHRPDFVLARNLAAIRAAVELGLPTIADFSLNTANHRSAEWLRQIGVERLTASYDLNRDQLTDLVTSTPPKWLEIVVHQHMPMFHMEHCVFCSVLSPGTNKHNCGRPCDDHVVQLRDRVGAEHTLQADIACRNTLYNASAQSGSEIVGTLQSSGIRWFRVELLNQTPAETKTTIDLYTRLIAGQMSGSDVWKKLSATNQLGVTRGTLEPKRNPLAIL